MIVYLLKTFILQFIDYVNMKCYSTADSSHDDYDTDEDGYTDMSNLSLPLPMASNGNSKKLNDAIIDEQFSSGQVEVLTQILQKLTTNETRESITTSSPTMTRHERPNLDYLMQKADRSST